MSPLSVRRYRAERLLREDFARCRQTVIAIAHRRLATRGISVDPADLEAFYAQAWHGLYATVLDGEAVANPVGWLALVTFRRALEEHRARTHARGGDPAPVEARAQREGADLAAALDDRVRLRQLMEGLRARLSARELQAASLCYLQGLSRAEASRSMGVSEARLRKLMDGHRGRRGVAHKVAALAGTITAGEWCDEQGSLMRGFAYGILDPAGERYELACAHHSHCPACRAYVLSLRGLAAQLPPAPWLLPWALGSAGAAGSGALPAGSAAGAGAAAGAAASASGAAGGGWLFAAGSGVKLALGCALALSVGAGCVALTAPHRSAARARAHARSSALRTVASSRSVRRQGAAGRVRAGTLEVASRGGGASALAVSARREFGVELGTGAPLPVRAPARAASTSRTRAPAPSGATVRARRALASAAASREFAPG